MSVIFYFSSRSTAGIGVVGFNRFLLLKTFHLIEYAALAAFFYFGFKKYKYSIISAYLYALTDEFHQTFISGRSGKVTDTFIDLAGILLGLFFVKFILLRVKAISKLF
jgi:VanZ family protein